MKKLDVALQEYYANKTLSDQQLGDLERLLNRNTSKGANLQCNRVGKPEKPLFGRVCAVAAVMFIGAWFLLSVNGSYSQRIMEQIVFNHHKQMVVEVFGQSMEDISSELNLLDFQLQNSERLPSDRWEIIGGRYCTIDNQLAAQLKVKNLLDGQIYTFYQAKIPAQQILAKTPIDGFIDGVKVQIWSEKDLLMGLAVN